MAFVLDSEKRLLDEKIDVLKGSIAEKKMYQDKKEYYKKHDRRS